MKPTSPPPGGIARMMIEQTMLQCKWCKKDIDPQDLIMYQVGPVKTSAGVSLQGDYSIGHFAPGREGNYIHGIPDAHDLLNGFTWQEAVQKLQELQSAEYEPTDEATLGGRSDRVGGNN